MVTRETKIGVAFAIISNFIGGFQPVWANMRPVGLDSHVFSAMSCLFQALIFLPIFLIEFRYNKDKRKNLNIEAELLKKPQYRLFFGKSKWGLFLVVGTLFSLVMFLYYYGLALAGSINGTLGVKTTAIFGLVYGFLLLKEDISKIQVIFSIVLFFGMIIAVTQGAFQLLQLNIGVIIILICSSVWMLGHTASKPYLYFGITTPSELLVVRNAISSAVLIGAYLILFGPQIIIIFIPEYAFSYIIMAAIYGSNLFCWYQILKYLDVSIGTILITPQIIVTAIFGTLLLQESFTIFHLIGLIIMCASIVIINYKPMSKK
ncbi:MAG: DMT family transporter [Candidatus Lokiarchaeota archaeon]|nr:DMT family transporter [Candidatus Lokiarchaeota archaeon]